MRGHSVHALLGVVLVSVTGIVVDGSAAARPLCFGKPATIVGTSGADTIKDTPGADVIVTRGGPDVVDAFIEDLSEPRDRICTGDGADRVEGGLGRIDGGSKGDVIDGATGRLFGRGGNDRLRSSSASVVRGGPGDDSISGMGRLIGGSGADDIKGESGVLADTLIGGAGNDRFTTFDSDTFVNLFDRVSYKSAPRRIRVNLRTGVVRGWGRDRLLGPDTMEVIGSRFNDRFIGGDAVIAGLHGSEGDDQFEGSPINDSFSGGSGDDHLDARGGPDYLSGGPGDDKILGGGSKEDLVSFQKGSSVVVDLAKHFARGQGQDVVRGVERLWGSSGPDRILGTSDANVLYGGKGRDVIKGRRGPDEVDGFRGRDEKLYGNRGDDQLWAPVFRGERDQTSLLDGGGGRDECVGGRQRSCEVELTTR